MKKILVSASLFMLSTPAFAGSAVVPLLHGQGVDTDKLIQYSRLIASEVEYHEKYDKVTTLNEKESKITPECLRSTRCVYKHGRAKGATTVIAGKVLIKDSKLEFYIVLCQRGYFKRNVRFQLENETLAVAEGLGAYIEDLVVGTKKKKVVKKEPPKPEPKKKGRKERRRYHQLFR